MTARFILVASGQYFVGHGMRSINAVLQELVREAQKEILVAVYRMSLGGASFLQMLAEAVEARGISVRIVVHALREQPREIQSMLEAMEQRWPGTVFDFHTLTGEDLHAKVVIVDRRKAVIGSSNLTWGGLIANHEIGVLIEGPAVWDLARVFDRLLGFTTTLNMT